VLDRPHALGDTSRNWETEVILAIGGWFSKNFSSAADGFALARAIPTKTEPENNRTRNPSNILLDSFTVN
jgi:hypothetical protein